MPTFDAQSLKMESDASYTNLGGQIPLSPDFEKELNNTLKELESLAFEASQVGKYKVKVYKEGLRDDLMRKIIRERLELLFFIVIISNVPDYDFVTREFSSSPFIEISWGEYPII